MGAGCQGRASLGARQPGGPAGLLSGTVSHGLCCQLELAWACPGGRGGEVTGAVLRVVGHTEHWQRCWCLGTLVPGARGKPRGMQVVPTPSAHRCPQNAAVATWAHTWLQLTSRPSAGWRRAAGEEGVYHALWEVTTQVCLEGDQLGLVGLPVKCQQSWVMTVSGAKRRASQPRRDGRDTVISLHGAPSGPVCAQEADLSSCHRLSHIRLP